MWKGMLVILLFCTIVFRGDMSSIVLIDGIVPINQYGDAAPYTCIIDDNTVHLAKAPTEFFREYKGALAAAVNGPRGRAILVDGIDFFDNHLTPEFQHFILAHECAHHELGHQDKNSAYVGAVDKQPSEAAADCRAIKRLTERGFGQAQFDVILNQISDSSDEMAYLINVEKSDKYKAASGRSDDIKICIENVND